MGRVLQVLSDVVCFLVLDEELRSSPVLKHPAVAVGSSCAERTVCPPAGRAVGVRAPAAGRAVPIQPGSSSGRPERRLSGAADAGAESLCWTEQGDSGSCGTNPWPCLDSARMQRAPAGENGLFCFS